MKVMQITVEIPCTQEEHDFSDSPETSLFYRICMAVGTWEDHHDVMATITSTHEERDGAP